MTVNFTDGLERVTQIMRGCIQKEIGDDGLLGDVETFIPIYHHETKVEEPCIWMTQHPTTCERQADISRTMDLITPFEFDCVVYEDDLEDSEYASQNLTTRVILSIVRNYQIVQMELFQKRIIKNITLDTYYSVGEIQIQGKSDRVPATGVILNVTYPVNWKMCCKELNNNNDNIGDENGD